MAHTPRLMMRRSHRNVVAWIAAVALLGNVLGVFAPAEATQAADEILGPMVICTAAGAAAAERDGSPLPARRKHGGAHCPSCLLLGSGAPAAEAGACAFPAPSRCARPSREPSSRTGEARLSLGGIGCRAPPLPM